MPLSSLKSTFQLLRQKTTSLPQRTKQCRTLLTCYRCGKHTSVRGFYVLSANSLLISDKLNGSANGHRSAEQVNVPPLRTSWYCCGESSTATALVLSSQSAHKMTLEWMSLLSRFIKLSCNALNTMYANHATISLTSFVANNVNVNTLSTRT